MSDVQRWHDTEGAGLRRILGIVNESVALRAEEIDREERRECRDRSQPRPERRTFDGDVSVAATVAAEREAFKIPAQMSTAEFKARWDFEHPFHRLGVNADTVNDEEPAIRVLSPAGEHYFGTPAGIERLKAACDAADGRQRQAAQMDRQAMGRFYNTVH